MNVGFTVVKYLQFLGISAPLPCTKVPVQVWNEIVWTAMMLWESNLGVSKNNGTPKSSI